MDNPSLNNEKIYTVLELNTIVRTVIKREFPQYIWVCGEIQGLRPERSKKHTYFELVQKHTEKDEIIAKIKVALFGFRKPVIQKRIKEAQGAFELKNDIEVKFLCEVSLHPPTGQYSLVVIDVDPIYTLGKIAQSRQKIIEELRKKGLLERNKLIPIPSVPLRIGLITAFDSAAYHDFINEIKACGYGFRVLSYNCHMQGKAVEADVIAALRYFNTLGRDKLDIIVITRGGGSTADLSFFDNKKIAQEIALGNYPVVSAIGHQIDTTITDIVANTFCKTPTKAAQFLIDKVRVFLEELDNIGQMISQVSQDLLRDKKNNLQSQAMKLDSSSIRYFRFHRENLLEKQHNMLSLAKRLSRDERKILDNIFDNLKSALAVTLKSVSSNLRYLDEKISILSPRNTLKRGYSITLKGKKAVKSIDQLKPGDKIKSVFYQGAVTSKVENKEESNE